MSLEDPSNPAELGLELSQNEIEGITQEDWSFYVFWQEIQSLTLDNLYKDGRSYSFGSGDYIIGCFEQTVSSDEYSPEYREQLKRIQKEKEFENITTAEMYQKLGENNSLKSVLDDLEDDDSVNPSSIRELLNAAEAASRERLETYKE